MAMSSHIHRPVLRFETGAAAHPHPKRTATGGEDAFFVFHLSPFYYSLGIADGVAEWRQKIGVNPAVFSRKLVEGAKFYIRDRLRWQQDGAEDMDFPHPCEVMSAAHNHVQTSRVIGSSTLCVVSLNGFAQIGTPQTGTLSACNLGDSQFVLFRNGRIIFKSERQHHFFGCPYQFGYAPNTEFCTVRDAETVSLPVQQGDLLILGSDGLFDNVMDYHIVQHVQSHERQNNIAPRTLAQKLADYALKCSQDKRKDTPHSLEATGRTGQIFRGGKLDDITVVVSKIVGA